MNTNKSTWWTWRMDGDPNLARPCAKPKNPGKKIIDECVYGERTRQYHTSSHVYQRVEAPAARAKAEGKEVK